MSRTRNVLSNWGGYAFSAVINFVLSPFVVHSLGDASYGIWVLLGSLVGYLGLLDLGVRAAVTRFIAKFHTQENHLEATRVASSALVVFSVIGLLAIAIASILAAFIGQIFEIPADLVSVAGIVLILGGVNIGVSLVSGVYGGVVAGLQRFDHINAVEVVIGAFRAAAIFLALNEGMGLVSLAAIQLGMSAARGLANYWLSRRLYPEMRAVFTECRRKHLKMIFSFSASVLLLQASGMLILFSDAVVIGSFLPIGMVTFFAIAANLTEYARAPISGISTILTPSASALEAGDERDDLQRVLLVGSRISTLIILPIVITFMLRGQSFIGLWMGEEYAEPAGEVLYILSLALAVAVGYQVVVATMMGISKHRGLVPAFMVEAVFNVGLSVIWLQSYGIIGVAWGTTAPRLLASLFFAPWYVKRVLGTPISLFWRTVWIRPAVAMLPFAAGSWFIEQEWPADNLILYFAQVSLVLPLAALGAWLVSLTHEEKSRLLPPGSVMRFVTRAHE